MTKKSDRNKTTQPDSDETSADSSQASAAQDDVQSTPDEAETGGFTKGEKVTYRGARAEITGVHADGTVDVHLLNDDGSLKLNADGSTPLWYERIGTEELTAER